MSRTTHSTPANGALFAEALERRHLLHGSIDLSIDFQPAGSIPEEGMLVDQGMPFGGRDEGLSYGWRRDSGPWINRWTYERDHPGSGSHANDTLISAGWAGDLSWEIALPAGRYIVTLTAGDALAQPGQRFVGALEGQVVLDFTAAPGQLFKTVTQEVDVSDGRLTLTAPDGLANTTFSSITITSIHDENGGSDSHGAGGASSNSTSTTSLINFEEFAVGNVGTALIHASGHRFRSLPGGSGTTTEDLWIRGISDKYASKVLHPFNYARKIVLDRIDGASFSLTSFEYGAGRYGEPGDATVTGFFAAGGSASQTVSFSSRALNKLTVNWNGLSKVEINFAGGANNAYGAVDNFVVATSDGGGGGGGGGGGFNESGGRVDFQAEASTGQAAGSGNAASHTWSQISDAAAGGGLALQATPNIGVGTGDATNGPRRDYSINFTTTGTYYVWVRSSGDTGADDSYHVGLNGTLRSGGSLGMGSTGGWTWRNTIGNGTRVTVNVASAGTHTFNLWMREDGVKVDQFILTKDANFVPTGGGGGGGESVGNITLGSWTVHGSMPTAMMEGGVAVIGSNVYLWGGFNSGSTWLSQKHGWRYNTSTNMWARIADLPAPITHGQMIVYQGRIYLFGGYANNGSWLGNTDAVYMYDPATNAFSHWNTIPYKISGHGAAMVGTRVHLLGGHLRDSQNRFTGNSVRHVSIDMANPSAGWRDEPDVPAGRDHVAAEYLDGGIYYFAGQIGDNEYTGVRPEMWRYDVTARAWSSRAAMPDGGRGHIDQATAVFGGQIITVAGNINAPVLTNYSDEVFAYNPATDSWRLLGLIPDWRRGCQVAVIADRLWVFGGGTSYPRDNLWSAPLTLTS